MFINKSYLYLYHTIKQIEIMTAIVNVSLKQINSIICPQIDKLNGFKAIVAELSNGGLKTFQSLLSEIGNNNLDNWNNIEKIRKSTSDKNRFNYIKQFESELNNIGII